MTISCRSWRWRSRRAFARISIIVRLGESSMNSGASASSDERSASRRQSWSLMCPERMFCSATPASAENSRIMISSLPISREKMAVGFWCLTAAERAKSRASVDLPLPGRPATVTIWPGCRPLVISSSCWKPVGMPVPMPPVAEIFSISSSVLCSSVSMWT